MNNLFRWKCFVSFCLVAFTAYPVIAMDPEKPRTVSKIPYGLECLACESLLEEDACRTDCGHQYHQECIEALLDQTCKGEGCQRRLLKGKYFLAPDLEQKVNEFLSQYVSDSGSEGNEESSMSDYTPFSEDEQKLVADSGLEQGQSLEVGRHSSGAASPALSMSSEVRSKNQSAYVQAREGTCLSCGNISGMVETMDVSGGWVHTCCAQIYLNDHENFLESSQAASQSYKTDFPLASQPEQRMSRQFSQMVVSHPSSAKTYEKRCYGNYQHAGNRRSRSEQGRRADIEVYKEAFGDVYGEFHRWSPRIREQALIRPSLALREKGVEHFQGLFSQHRIISGYDFSGEQSGSEILSVLSQFLNKLKPGHYLILLAISDESGREEEPANLVVISRRVAEDDWDRGEVEQSRDKYGMEKKYYEYYLMVPSVPEPDDNKAKAAALSKYSLVLPEDRSQFFSYSNIHEIFYPALFFLFGYGREHAVLLAPKSDGIDTVDIENILNRRQLDDSQPVQAFFSLSDFLKTVILASGFRKTDLETSSVNMLVPLKIPENAYVKGVGAGDITSLDLSIGTILSLESPVTSLGVERDEEVLGSFSQLENYQVGAVKLGLDTEIEEHKIVYVFKEQSVYYLTIYSDTSLAVYSSDSLDNVKNVIQFLLLSTQPKARYVSLFF